MSPPSPSPEWNAIKLAPDDTVATALRALDPDTRPRISGGDASGPPRIVEPIPRGHKFALVDIAAGATVFKYGAPIGMATEDICSGAHVHLHNLEGFAGKEARRRERA
jgi:altronate hydrolase